MLLPLKEFENRSNFQNYIYDNRNSALIDECDVIDLLEQYGNEDAKEYKHYVAIFYKTLLAIVFYKKQGDKYFIMFSVPISKNLALKYI